MMTLTYEFVKFIPNELKENTLYISIEYCTIVHKCCCGCGNEVITPLSPNDWEFTFDGKAISLHPSIGNWNLKCKSHYWIRNNNVIWAKKWTEERNISAKEYDNAFKKRYYEKRSSLNKKWKLKVRQIYNSKIKKWISNIIKVDNKKKLNKRIF